MPDPVLLVERDAPIATVTLNRPDQMNALSTELRLAIGSAFRELEQDPEIRVAIVTGAGRAFCAGMDLKELSSGAEGTSAFELSVIGQQEMRDGIADFSGPVIAAVNGAAATAGFELALACDLILASSKARFLDTHARVGILPGWGLSVRLARSIGIARAKELSLSGNALDAAQAYEWGLVNRVVEPDELIDSARSLARDFASCVPEVMTQYKKLIDRGYSMHVDDAMEMEFEAGVESSKQIDSTAIAGRRKQVIDRPS
ncbi:MAG: enoyl-CoA hydratase [Myxococcota bacterium]|jgi:enoyl-CoA hydratase